MQIQTSILLSPERRKALVETLEHVRLVRERVAVAENILTDPRIRLSSPEDEPDDLSVAAASIEQALTCLAVAFEELELARFGP